MFLVNEGVRNESAFLSKEKYGRFILNLVVSEWKNKGQTNMDTESCGRFVEREH